MFTRRKLYTVDCSQFQQFFVIDQLHISFTSLLDNNVGPNGDLHVELVYAGFAWVALGVSQNSSGKMIPGYSVIGIPEPFAPYIPAYNPGKYFMSAKVQTGVNLMDASAQTLKNGNVTFNSTHTVMTYTKRLIESGEFPIHGDGVTTFQVAYGYSNFLSLHQYSTAFNFTLKNCVNGASAKAPTPVTASPTPPPTFLTASPTVNKVGQRVNCDEYQQFLGIGSAVQMSYTSLLDTPDGPNGYLRVQMVYVGQGWLGWGIAASSAGKMVPGESIIGIPGDTGLVANPGKYSMTAYTTSGVNLYPASQQTLVNSSIFQNSTHTILTFTKRLQETGEYEINGNGINTFFAAWGTSNTLGDHGYNGRQAFQYELYQCINGSLVGKYGQGALLLSTSSNKNFWNAHGVLAAVAWGILAPLGIGASLLRHYLTSDRLPAGFWFRIHQSFMLLVCILTIIAFSFAVVAIQRQGNQQHFKQVKHRTTGLVITILVCVQVFGGLIRPHVPHQSHEDDEAWNGEEIIEEKENNNENINENENGNGQDNGHENGKKPADPVKTSKSGPPKKPLKRLFWEIFHRALGATLLGFSWWQVQNGFGLYAVRFTVSNSKDVFWGVTGGISGVIVLLYVVRLVQLHCSKK